MFLARVYLNQCPVDVPADSRDDAILRAGKLIAEYPEIWSFLSPTGRQLIPCVTQVWDITPGRKPKLISRGEIYFGNP